MNQKSTLISGAVMGMLAVAIGAFGAHGLREILVANQRTETFELAVKYQFYHSFALLFTGVIMQHLALKQLRWAAVLFLIGILIFSGSLYTLSLTGITKLGAITPLGGLSFILGWVFLLAAFVKKSNA